MDLSLCEKYTKQLPLVLSENIQVHRKWDPKIYIYIYITFGWVVKKMQSIYSQHITKHIVSWTALCKYHLHFKRPLGRFSVGLYTNTQQINNTSTIIYLLTRMRDIKKSTSKPNLKKWRLLSNQSHTTITSIHTYRKTSHLGSFTQALSQ